MTAAVILYAFFAFMLYVGIMGAISPAQARASPPPRRPPLHPPTHRSKPMSELAAIPQPNGQPRKRRVVRYDPNDQP